MAINKEKFEMVMGRLNPAQKQAVETLDGPVLVVAGPGTGKTEILAARITNILSTTEAKPDNILCLTYTDAGTIAMRSRLLEFIGPQAYRVDVLTFHAFCGRVIQDQADHFGLRGLSAASDLERYGIVRQIIDNIPQGHPLARETGDIYYEAKRLLELYSIMKQEGWTPEWLEIKVDEWVASMAEDPEYRYKRGGKNKDGSTYAKGDVNPVTLEKATKSARQFNAAAETFEEYQLLMRKAGRYDFADMILWVTEAFHAAPELLAGYHDKYTHVLVDEFQDTSGSQYELLMQLLEYSDTPNVFAVGDDDQSIYRFQGASVENLLRYQARFGENLTTVTLTENHRSSQNILDAAGKFISCNQERLAVDKNLKAVNPSVSNLPAQVELVSYPTLALETAGVAQQILALKEAGTPLNRIAVIYRNHYQAGDILRYLTAKEIPVVTRRRADALVEPLVEKLTGILRYLAAELRRPHSGESFLFKLLHEQWFGFSPLTMASFATGISRKAVSLNKAVTWREELLTCADLPEADCQQFKRAGEGVERMIGAAATMPLRDLIHHTVTEMGVLSIVLAGDDQVWNLELLNTFFDFVRVEGAKKPLDIHGLLALMDDMIAQGISLPAEKMSGAGEGVNFITSHGSKGLEFDHVFMIGCTSKAWDSVMRSRTYSLPPTVWRSIAGSEEEESRRLFYVGMTRTRMALKISFPLRDNNDKQLEQSRFVAELAEIGCLVIPSTITDPALVEFGATILRSAKNSLQSLFDDALVDAMMVNYRMSVSHLSAYLTCPTAFYYTRILHAPSPASLSIIFGLAIHAAEDFAFSVMMKATPRAFPPVEAFMDVFRAYIERHAPDFEPARYRRRMEYAETILPSFYKIKTLTWSKDALSEYSIRSVVVDGVPVTGKLDRIELFTGSKMVGIVDGKSGNYAYGKKKLRAPDAEKVSKALASGKSPAAEDLVGGDYWRQAVFYRILAEADLIRGWSATKVKFEFVEPDRATGELHEDVITVSDEDVETVKGQMVDVYAKIKNHEFAAGCDDPDCEWCRFAKQQAQALHLTPAEEVAAVVRIALAA